MARSEVAVGVVEQADRQFTQLFNQHYRDVYAYCRRRSNAQTAADCAAETFVVAWRRRDDLPADDAALPWLYGVARRVLANEFRGSRRRRRLFDRLRTDAPGLGAEPEVVVVRRDEDRRVMAALQRLRPAEQELLRLALWEELPHEQIAERLGCSTAAATQRIYRATRKAAAQYDRLERKAAAPTAIRQAEGGLP